MHAPALHDMGVNINHVIAIIWSRLPAQGPHSPKDVTSF